MNFQDLFIIGRKKTCERKTNRGPKCTRDSAAAAVIRAIPPVRAGQVAEPVPFHWELSVLHSSFVAHAAGGPWLCPRPLSSSEPYPWLGHVGTATGKHLK